MLQNLHTHTKYCDGRDTPVEMAERAIELGFSSLGFSSHANTRFSDTCELLYNVDAYVEEIKRIRSVYEGRLKILSDFAPSSSISITRL